jgi:hypothetical protein
VRNTGEVEGYKILVLYIHCSKTSQTIMPAAEGTARLVDFKMKLDSLMGKKFLRRDCSEATMKWILCVYQDM